MDPTAFFRGRQIKSSSNLNRKEVLRTQAGRDRPCWSRSSIGRAAGRPSPVQAASTTGGLNVCKLCTPLEYRLQPARGTKTPQHRKRKKHPPPSPHTTPHPAT